MIFIRLRSLVLHVRFSPYQDSERAEKWKSHEATTLRTIYDNLLDEMKVPGVCAQSDRA